MIYVFKDLSALADYFVSEAKKLDTLAERAETAHHTRIRLGHESFAWRQAAAVVRNTVIDINAVVPASEASAP